MDRKKVLIGDARREFLDSGDWSDESSTHEEEVKRMLDEFVRIEVFADGRVYGFAENGNAALLSNDVWEGCSDQRKKELYDEIREGE